MDAYQQLGYGMVLFGLLVALAIIVVVAAWVVLSLLQPWAERTVAKHVAAADATDYPELEWKDDE